MHLVLRWLKIPLNHFILSTAADKFLRVFVHLASKPMATTVLGIGIPHTSTWIPDERKDAVQHAIETMEAEMKNAPFEWETFFFEPHMSFDQLTEKLREKEWNCVLVGS